MGYRTYLQGCADYNEHCIYKISKGDVIMKVLITTDWYAPVINGVVTSVLNLERELRKKDMRSKFLLLHAALIPIYWKMFTMSARSVRELFILTQG